MKTEQEIENKARERKGDFLPFYIEAMTDFASFDTFKRAGVLNDDAKDDGTWTHVQPTREAVVAKILEYMPFAWEKANGERGISAGRSMLKMSAWLWLIGEEGIDCEDYDNYGKPQLRAICELLGFDWRKWSEL